MNPARSWRGGERQVFLLSRELAARGHSVGVVGDPEGPLLQRAAAAGLATHGIPMAGDADPVAIAKLTRLLRRETPDLLHLHTARAHAVGGAAARVAGCRPVLVTRRVELGVQGGWLGRWKYRELADHYVAISAAVEASLRAGGVPAERIDRIPSGVELPAESRREAPAGNRPWTVGTLGAFTPQKDPPTWLAAVRALAQNEPDIRFIWAGSGELAQSVEVGVKEAGLGDRVELPGFLEEPEDLLSAVDVFFLPSAFEALGTVFLDAMAWGLPIVATNVGGVPEVVREGREGLLAAPGDAPALAEALSRLRRDPALAARMGAAGRERAREFEIGTVVDRIERVYARLTTGGNLEVS